MSDFDFEGVFDEDYLYFYEEILTPEGTAAEVEQIAELLGPRDHVLDCPCGHGRIANGLAERGYRVTGIDQSELFLTHARTDAEAHGVDVEYVHGDMRELPWRDRFDALVNWFTSFGFFDDETDRTVLRGFHDALRPGGRLVLETQNPARLFRILESSTHVDEDPAVDVPHLSRLVRRDGSCLLYVTPDFETWRLHIERVIIRDGTVRSTQTTVRLYSYPELRDELVRAGFENVHPGIEPNFENRLVVVADRPSAFA